MPRFTLLFRTLLTSFYEGRDGSRGWVGNVLEERSFDIEEEKSHIKHRISFIRRLIYMK